MDASLNFTDVTKMETEKYYLALQLDAAPGLRKLAAAYIRWRLKTATPEMLLIKLAEANHV
jgi:hypothetical protein